MVLKEKEIFFFLSDVFWRSGPQLNINSSLLRGWSLCYNETYALQLNGLPLDNILMRCNRSKLLLACGLLSSQTIYDVAAMDYRQKVLYNCSYSRYCSHLSNGVQWYFSRNYSWGFAGESDNVDRSYCDVSQVQNPLTRLCWHTISGQSGYRCGSTFFNGSKNPNLWQRVIWHMD